MTPRAISVAGQTAQNGPGLMLTPSSGTRATPVAVTGGGCTSGATVSVSFRGHQLGVVKAGQPGEFSTTVVIPGNAPLGPGLVTTAGAGCRRSASFTVQVNAAGATTSAAPDTHSVSGLLEVVAGLAIFGLVLVFAVRRSRQTPHRHPPVTKRRRAARPRHRRREGREGAAADLTTPSETHAR